MSVEENTNILPFTEEIEIVERSRIRKRADKASSLRCKTLICVLENPQNVENIASVMRNIDALGITKLYVISPDHKIINCNKRKMRPVSASAEKWIYTKFFISTEKCIEYLKKNNFDSLVTSPHIKAVEK